jgi:hypothetical protein
MRLPRKTPTHSHESPGDHAVAVDERAGSNIGVGGHARDEFAGFVWVIAALDRLLGGWMSVCTKPGHTEVTVIGESASSFASAMVMAFSADFED